MTEHDLVVRVASADDAGALAGLRASWTGGGPNHPEFAAEMARWLKSEGDQVASGNPLVELETDKVNMEVTAPATGVLKSIQAHEGDSVVADDVLAVVAEALECHGGNGYVEESILPRLYREAPLNSIWEGAGNVNALDVLRAMQREPDTVSAYFGEVELARGADKRFDHAIDGLKRELTPSDGLESRARRVVERMAIVLQASLLLRHGEQKVADVFLSSRLVNDWGQTFTFGTLKFEKELKSVLERHRPRL